MAKQTKQSRRKTEQQSFFSSLSPGRQDLLSISLLFAITLFLFRGIVLEDAAFSAGGDTAAALSYQHAGDTIKETEGVDPLWMPYFFSGMPTFGNVAYLPHNISYVQIVVIAVLNIVFLNSTWGWLVVFYFLGGVFMFFLMRIWSTSRIASLFAAITFMLSPYAIGLAGEGHGSKLMALMYLPAVFLLTHMMFEKRNLFSFGLLSAAIGTLLLTNHMQIVYYVLMVVGFYLIYNVFADFKAEKALIPKKIALFAGAALIGLAISSYIYLSVYEYAQYSIRGGGTTGVPGGLSWDYATSWSWHPQELLTLLIPGFFGFQNPYYWGTMPFTNSTVYIGLLPLLFSIVALVYRRTRVTLFFGILTLLVFLVSFGKHFAVFYELLFRFLPFFNKFRAPAMILHLIPFTLGVLGAFGLEYLLELRAKLKEGEAAKLIKTLLYVVLGLGVIFVVGFLMKTSLQQMMTGSFFVKSGELEYFTAQYGAEAARRLGQLQQVRFEKLASDFVKFVFLGGISLGLVLAFLKRKMSSTIFAGAVLALLCVDLYIVIKEGNFIDPKPKADLTRSFLPDATIQYLKGQGGIYRVYPVGQGQYDDNTFAYHGIQSIGGYSPAKLKIFQEMVDSAGLYPPRLPFNMNILNMLSAKYFLVPGRLPEPGRLQVVNVDQARGVIIYENPDYFPRAWFVDTYEVAKTNEKKFASILSSSFDPRVQAVLEEEPRTKPVASDSTHVEVAKYESHRIQLKTFSNQRSLLVLSEIYYPAGWNAMIDGAETEIYRTNSILRSVVVPAGDHEVVFSFDPPMYHLGYSVSNGAWALTGLLILVGAWRNPSIRNRFGKKAAEREQQES
ncbi:MAG TPA: YfhO family protein [Bacteroidota bacterium]